MLVATLTGFYINDVVYSEFHDVCFVQLVVYAIHIGLSKFMDT